jgi:hypothetical protein
LLQSGDHGVAAGSAMIVGGAAETLARAAVRMARDPFRNLEWGLEVAANAVSLAERGVAGPTTARDTHRNVPSWTPAFGKA